MGFIMLPMVLPEIIIGVSLLVVIVQLGFELSLFTIILGHISDLHTVLHRDFIVGLYEFGSKP